MTIENVKLSTLLVLFILFLFLPFAGTTYAADPAPQPTPVCNESIIVDRNGRTTQNGLVPCGRATDNNGNLMCRCELVHIFILIKNVFDFFRIYIATPVAGLMIMIGGIIIMISGGPGGKSPIGQIAKASLYDTGKKMVIWSIVSVLIIWGSWLIIDITLKAIGYTQIWSSPF